MPDITAGSTFEVCCGICRIGIIPITTGQPYLNDVALPDEAAGLEAELLGGQVRDDDGPLVIRAVIMRVVAAAGPAVAAGVAYEVTPGAQAAGVRAVQRVVTGVAVEVHVRGDPRWVGGDEPPDLRVVPALAVVLQPRHQVLLPARKVPERVDRVRQGAGAGQRR